MTGTFVRMWREDHGVLTFEWILLITVLVIGIVGGLTATRDAIISELGDMAFAVTALDQSWTLLDCDGEPIIDPKTGDPIGFDDDPEFVATCRPAPPPVSPDNPALRQGEAQEAPNGP